MVKTTYNYLAQYQSNQIVNYLQPSSMGLWFFSKKNILIPNVAEQNTLILVEEKKII
jgi:ADP-dependent phosphofructokinase/glucokinase